MANPFANRIINYGTKAADQFMPNELNWRTHPQQAARWKIGSTSYKVLGAISRIAL